MSVAARLSAFAAVLAVAFGGAALAGAAIGGDGREAPPAPHGADHGAASAVHGDGHSDGAASVADREAASAHEVAGLSTHDGGLRLDLARTRVEPGVAVPFSFRVLDARGRALRDFDVDHDKRLHLIVVRRDTATFEHVHPRMAPDGTWSVDLDLRRAGAYRVFADFTVEGRKRTLGADLLVPGEFDARSFTRVSREAATAGLDVALRGGTPRAGRESTVTFAVSRDGTPFDGLEPYLGAKGHLVALREGDLAYLHVHPVESGEAHAHADGSRGTEGHGDEIAFAATFPTPGRYRLFLDFKAGGQVRTAAFTIEVTR